MKVLFLTNIPSPYRVDFFNELGKYCDLTVVFEGEYATDRDSNWSFAEIKTFKPVFLDGIRVSTDKFLSFGVLKLFKEKWDFVITGMYSTPTIMLAIEYMRIKKIPFIFNADGGFARRENKFNFLFKKHFISAASVWLSTGKATTDYLVYYGAIREKCYTYPFTSVSESDVLTSAIAKEEKFLLKEKNGIKEKKCIISVGQFIKRKGFDILVEAIKDLNGDVGVYIIGGEPTEELIDLKTAYGLKNLHFVGFKTKEELSEYYKVADLFVLPTREDIWGLVINEAMSYGLPVITTNRCISGLEMVVDGKTGYIVESENVKQLSEAINKAFELPENTWEYILSVSSDYTIENMAKRHIEILCSLA